MNKMDISSKLLDAGSPQKMLRRITEFIRASGEAAPDSLSTVTIYTSSGKSFLGFPADIAFDNNKEYLLFNTIYGNKVPSGSILYIPLSEVMALEIMDAFAMGHILSGGKILKPRAGEAPTRLELNRLLKSMSEKIEQKYGINQEWGIAWDVAPDSESARWVLKDCLDKAFGVITGLLADKMAAQELAKFKKIIFLHAEGSAVGAETKGNMISVKADLTRETGDSFCPGLEKALNKVL